MKITLTFILILITVCFCSAQNLSQDSLNRSSMNTWSNENINKFCDSLLLGRDLKDFNGLDEGKFDLSYKGMKYHTDDFSYLFKGKIQDLELVFKNGKLIAKFYYFSNSANQVLSSLDMLQRLKAIPINVASSDDPVYLIQSDRYTIKEGFPAKNHIGLILITDRIASKN